MAKCSQVRLVLKHREQGHLLVVQPPCRLKTCDDCWAVERDRLEGVLWESFSKCRSCSIVFVSIGITPTFWDSFSTWARRNQRLWVAIPLLDGEVMLLVEGSYPTGVKVLDVQERIQRGLKNHDRKRRMSSCRKIRLSSSTAPSLLWQLLVSSRADQERIAEIAEAKGMGIEWKGPNVLKVLGTEEQINELVREVA